MQSLINAAEQYLNIGASMITNARPERLQELVRQLVRTAHNSLRSVIVLANHGCGTDALKIARSIFEVALTVHYLPESADYIDDYVDFLWVKQKKHLDYLREHAPSHAQSQDSARVAEVEAQYHRVKTRFLKKGERTRDSWHQHDRRQIARRLMAESMYCGLYPFTSSVTHMDALGLNIARGGEDEVLLAPSQANVDLALLMAINNYAMVLSAWDEIGNCNESARLQNAFEMLRQVSQPRRQRAAGTGASLDEERSA
jgi:hypothetical protein